MTIRLDNVKYTIPPEGYLIENTLGHLCVVGISPISDSQGMYILGDVFLRNFYTTFDFGSNDLRLAINANAAQEVYIETVLSGWAIFGIILACLVGLSLIILLVLCIIKKQRAKKQKRKSAAFLAQVHSSKP